MSPIKKITQTFLAITLLVSVILLTGCAAQSMAPGPYQYEEAPVVDIAVGDFLCKKTKHT